MTSGWLALAATGLGIFNVLVLLLDRFYKSRTAVTAEQAVDKGWSTGDRMALARWQGMVDQRLDTFERAVKSQDEFHNELVRLMARVGHSPHTPELDVLLEKVMRNESVTWEELRKMSNAISKILRDPKEAPGRQVALGIVMTGLKKRRGESPDAPVSGLP